MGAEIATVRKKKLGRIQNVKSMKWLVVALACGLAVPAAMGAALWFLMGPLDAMFSGTTLERVGAILAIMATGLASFGIAAFLLWVLDKATVGRLMRRQT